MWRRPAEKQRRRRARAERRPSKERPGWASGASRADRRAERTRAKGLDGGMRAEARLEAMKILLPNTITLDLDDHTDGDADTVLVYDPRELFSDEHLDADVLVAWYNTAENLRDAAQRLTVLRLVQALAAGPDSVLAAGFADSVAIASGRSLHDGPVAEHALALILSAVRSLDELRVAQNQHEWNTTVDEAQVAPETRGRYTLDGAQVTIWAFGSI